MHPFKCIYTPLRMLLLSNLCCYHNQQNDLDVIHRNRTVNIFSRVPLTKYQFVVLSQISFILRKCCNVWNWNGTLSLCVTRVTNFVYFTKVLQCLKLELHILLMHLPLIIFSWLCLFIVSCFLNRHWFPVFLKPVYIYIIIW
jgi:hypothetical protein